MRLQVMHLPAPADEYPFALVIDQCENPDDLGDLSMVSDVAKASLGARGVLVFNAEVEVA